MADEVALADACEDTEKSRLLALLRDNMVIRLSHDFRPGVGDTIEARIEFDGELVDQDWLPLMP